MASYLVTGGAGFIGSNIVEKLVQRNMRVRVLDSFITGKRENLKPFMGDIELIEGDIRDRAVLDKALKGIDFVLHQAALRSVPKSVEDPFITNDINITGTLNLLVAAREAGIKRVVYASSSAAYGNAVRSPQRESDVAIPISPYGVSKLAAENYCVTFAKTLGLETVSLRYFNVFGPRQNPESKYSAVIPAFLFTMMKDKPPTVEWDGKQIRDFVFVKDVVEANLLAAHGKGISGEVFNIGCGESHSILEIVKILNKLLGRNLKPHFAPKRKGDARETLADISRAKKILKFKPRVSLERGIQLTIDWFRS